MSYTSGNSVTVKYAIPPEKYTNNVLANYHLEAYCIGTNIKKNYAGASIKQAIPEVPEVIEVVAIGDTPAVAPVAGVPGVPGEVVFNGVATLVNGPYVLAVYYADAAVLDTAGSVKVGSGLLNRFESASVITL